MNYLFPAFLQRQAMVGRTSSQSDVALVRKQRFMSTASFYEHQAQSCCC